MHVKKIEYSQRDMVSKKFRLHVVISSNFPDSTSLSDVYAQKSGAFASVLLFLALFTQSSLFVKSLIIIHASPNINSKYDKKQQMN